MATTHVEVVCPTQVLYSGEAEMVVCRTVEGEIAFLADHVPFLGALAPCVTRIVAEGGEEVRVAVGGGLVEVRDNRVIVLAERAELGGDVDIEVARADLRDAEARAGGDEPDPVALADAGLAQARLDAAGASPA